MTVNGGTFDPDDDEHRRWRARCEALAARWLAEQQGVVDVRERVDLTAAEPSAVVAT